jgi:hypothetical protein
MVSNLSKALLIMVILSTPSPGHAQDVPSASEARTLAMEAYVYLYPLVSMDITRLQQTNVAPDSVPGRAPANSFAHIRAYPEASWREVVRPNFDTLYSLAWLDLTDGPVIVSVPETQGRYYLLPMLDMWSDVFAVPGSRTTGARAADFAVVPPRWTGSLPQGVERIDAPTPRVWVIGRTQTNGPKDYAAVHKIQDGFKITPLSNWNTTVKPLSSTIDASVDMKTPPLEQVNTMPSRTFFAKAAELMKSHPPHLTDWSIVARMKRIGIEPGKSFEYDKLSPTVQTAVDGAAAAGLQAMKAKLPTMAVVKNGWQMNTDTMGVYGNYYLKRAIISLVGLGANQPDDAIYPLNIADADGKPMDGANKYVMHFAKDELPPVDAFWSITMYDEGGFQTENLLNRFAIGDRDEIAYNADGSLDIYMQHETPGTDKEANWLPAPQGPLGVTMRLYAPKPQVQNGSWAPPPVKKVN